LDNRRVLGRRHARGFTLAELMVGLAVIGILLVVALPFYKGYRERMAISQAENDIVAISLAVRNYWLDTRAYPASLADIGLTGKLDPWGHAYAYYNIDANGKGGARKDHALNPLNTDFDVYSMGADGKTKPQITQKDSLDDVIRASNGTFVGLASDF
jgi:general secretion pathway protein G